MYGSELLHIKIWITHACADDTQAQFMRGGHLDGQLVNSLPVCLLIFGLCALAKSLLAK